MIKGVDLHAHLEGSIPISTLNRIRKRNGKGEIKQTFLSGLSQFSSFFGEISRSFSKESDFEEATRDFLLYQYKNGVIYTEFRVSPYHHVMLGGKSIKLILESIINGIKQANDICGIIGKIIMESARQYGTQHVNQVLDRTIGHYESEYIVGFGLGGIEFPKDLNLYHNIFIRCEKEGIPVSLHASEDGNKENLIIGARMPSVKRIGHGLGFNSLSQKEKVEFMHMDKLIEICISSNVSLGHVKTYHEHPIKDMINYNIPINISTDDSMIFSSGYEGELDKLIRITGISNEKIDNMNINSMNYAFCSEHEKKFIKDTLINNGKKYG